MEDTEFKNKQEKSFILEYDAKIAKNEMLIAVYEEIKKRITKEKSGGVHTDLLIAAIRADTKGIKSKGD